ncbi:MAG: hypothetical protein EZS28_048599, partial [Streblomastix strix]
ESGSNSQKIFVFGRPRNFHGLLDIYQTHIYPSPKGMDTVSGGGQQGSPFRSVERGIREAVDGSGKTYQSVGLTVRGGNYLERRALILNNATKKITVKALSPHNTYIVNEPQSTDQLTVDDTLFGVNAGELRFVSFIFRRHVTKTANAKPLLLATGGKLIVDLCEFEALDSATGVNWNPNLDIATLTDFIDPDPSQKYFHSAHIQIQGGGCEIISTKFHPSLFDGPSAIIATDFFTSLYIRSCTFSGQKDKKDKAAALDIKVKEAVPVLIDSCIFDQCLSIGGAGAVYVVHNFSAFSNLLDSFVVFSACEFTSNVAWESGAIGVGGSTQNMRFEFCSFSNNTGSKSGNDYASDVYF